MVRFRLRCAIAGVGLVAAAPLFVQWRTQVAWTAFESELRILARAHAARPAQRVAAFGDTTEAHAWTHYDLATTLARPLADTDNTELVATLRRSDAQVAAETADLRARWQPVLAALHAGAHAGDVRQEATRLRHTGNMLVDRWIANMAVFTARAALHEGRDLEAVQSTLDGATFAADRMRTGTLIDQVIGAAVLAICTSEVWTEARLDQLDEVALATLHTGLDRIDASLPTTLDLASEYLELGRILHDVPQDGADWLPKGSLWCMLSPRWMLADAFVQAAAMARRLDTTASVAWPERRLDLEQPLPASALSNPMLAVMLPNLASCEGSRREALSLLRLLRMSVALHLGEPAPRLDDPLGSGPLAIAEESDSMRLSSVGSAKRATLARVVVR
ncbi:MAG: hypothetical protein JNK15_21340 [Planctomycetes bacterium]|nr:hypothetical protein [Planctomycetota bacterium]